MPEPKRGEIWIADLGRVEDAQGAELMKTRPALVVSRIGSPSPGDGLVLVVPASTTRIDLPSHLPLETGEAGLDQPSYLACEEVRTISVEQLDLGRGPVGRVSESTLEEVDGHVERILDGEGAEPTED